MGIHISRGYTYHCDTGFSNLSVYLHASHAISSNGMWNLEYEKAEISQSRSYQPVNEGFTALPGPDVQT